jgi:hypothetical protein
MDPLQPSEQKTPEGQYPSSELVSPVFLLVSVVITTILVGFFVYRWTTHFDTTDGQFNIEYLTPKKTKAFDAIFAAPVAVGLTIKSFRKFDVLHNQFEFDSMVWFDFDPSIVSVNSVADFSFIRGEILYKSKPIAYAHDGHIFLVYNNVHVAFTNPLNFKYFPVDDHRISIGLINNATQINELRYFVHNNDFVIKENLIGSGWHQFGQQVQTGYTTTHLENNDIVQPMALFTIDYGRGRNTRNSLIMILPMLILFFVALFSFAAKKFDSRLSIPIQSLVGLVAFRFVLEAISPIVGYFMYIDYLFVVFLLLIFILVLFGSMAIVIRKSISKFIIIALNALLVGIFWYLL